jgi:hypothetical protein
VGKVKNIIKGHVNEVFNKETDFRDSRIAICRQCPLYSHTSIGLVCNSEYYLDPLTDSLSTYPKIGYFKGCGCRLEAKTRVKDEKCPAKKW